jgi:hypothetical protein
MSDFTSVKEPQTQVTLPLVSCSTARPKKLYLLHKNAVYVQTLYHNSSADNNNNHNNQEKHNNSNNYKTKHINHMRRQRRHTAGSIPYHYQLHHAYQSRFYQLVMVEDRG